MKTSMLFTFNVVVAIAIGLSSSPALCQNLFDDLRIDDRGDGAILVSWLVNGDIKDVEGCRITIESPLKDGAIGVELNAAETLSLLGPDNRHHYKFQPITNDISHGVTVELLKGGRVAAETVHIESARKCYEPDIEENGCLEEKIHYPVPSGTVVTYCCNIGYGLYDPGTESCTGVKQAVCQDGVWTIPPPQCTRQCEEPSETPQEDWLKEFISDAKLSRSKREGVDHIDPCVPGCADPGTPENGLQVGRHAYPVCSRTGVSFKCEDDYRLVGRHTIVCDDGHWSGPIPSCVEGCSDPGYPEHGGQYGTMEYPAEEGTEVTFYCDSGYGLLDPDTNECKESTTSTCADGMWTEAVPLCKAKCEDPGTPMEGRQPVHRFYPVCSGTVVQFECHYMHRLIGDERIECVDGHWTNPSPSCEVMCKDPGSPDNGGQTESMQYPAISGAKVSYYCDAGYQLYDGNTNACIEELSITCSDGSWTNSMPLCVQKCNNPGVPEHGYQKEGYHYPVCHGTELSFACTEKHNLAGEDTIKCTDGEWSAALPLCAPSCDDPGTPDNGHVLDDHAYPVDAGTIVRYCCDEGYDLVGETAARCNEDGAWSSLPPVCVGRCDDPGAPEYGYQTLQLEYPVKSGTSVTFACNSGYSLSGSGTSTCVDGHWVPPAEGNSCTEIDECSSNPCMNGGTCIDGFDRYDCLCPINYEGQNCESEYGICYVWGDPHYMTYDGEKYEFQGQCSYILTESASSSLTRFKVVVDNEAWTTLRDDEVSVTAQLIVTVHGKDIRLLRNLDVYVDDEPVTLPIQPLPDVYVRRTGRYVTIVSDFGLTVRWDGNHQGDVKVHGEYRDTLRGLCGNFNGDPSDDFTDPNGLLIPDGMEHTHRAAMFGNSWVSNEEECDSVAGGCNPCASDVDIADEAYDLCKVLKDEHGPFAACHPTIDPDQFFSACMFDVCSKLPDKSGVCMNAEAYAQVCLDNRVALSWRTEDTCPITCVNDRVYSNTISPCVKTCHDARPHYACVESRLVEGCTCPDGLFVNLRGSCVQTAECGCTVDENYLPYGDSFVKEHCDEECTCVTDGRLDCVAIRCDPNAYCGDDGGVRNCYCDEGYHGNGKKCEGYHCYSEPCQNNATCIELSSTYRCECLPGWQGDNCEEDIDECASNPCQNGGTCIDKVHGYECICTTEWEGHNCESEKTKDECDDPGTPENGLQVDGHEYPVPSGTTVTYACYSGFDLVGAQHIQCLDGEWTDSMPECVEQELELRQCEDPGTPDNGGLVDPVTFPVSSGTTIEYECDDYYDLFGPETITCDDGTWTPETPTLCLGRCDDPGPTENGQPVESHTYPVITGTNVTYLCDPGYKATGTTKITCYDGQWSDEVPKCEDIDECASNPCRNGGTCIDKVNGYECICPSEWEGPNCGSGTCDDPGTPDNGFQVEDHEYPVSEGTIVTYDCNDGYDLFGEQELTCVNENWSHEEPTCLKQCDDPGVPENGDLAEPVTYPVTSGTTVEFECDEWYAIEGDSQLKCDNGSWEGEFPNCVKDGWCDDPGEPANGFKAETYPASYPVPPGTEITYECDSNHDLFGSYTTKCTNGVWDPDIPECLERCDDPGTPENGKQVGHNSYPVATNTVVYFECDQDYQTNDTSAIICYDGEWSDEVPVCYPAPCEFNNNVYANGTVIHGDQSCDACVCYNGNVHCTMYWNEDIPCEMTDDQQSTPFKSSSKLKTEGSKSLSLSVDSQCPADMTCQMVTSECLLEPGCDNEVPVCRANSELQTIVEESTPCYGHTTGTSGNCGVMEIVFDHSAITESETLAVLCQDLGRYLKEELSQFPECSAVNCETQPDSQRLSGRDRREDIDPLIVRTEVEIKPPSVESSSTNNNMLDLMAVIERTLQEGIDSGELPGDLAAAEEVFLIVDGGWSEPHPLTQCNVTCGGLGWQKFIRNCTNPPPSNGGAGCEGKEEGSRPCFEECTTAAPTAEPITHGNYWMILVLTAVAVALILLIALLLLYLRRGKQKKKEADKKLEADHAEVMAMHMANFSVGSVSRSWQMRSSMKSDSNQQSSGDFYERTMVGAESRGDIPLQEFNLHHDGDDGTVDETVHFGRLRMGNTRDSADNLSISPSEMGFFDNSGYSYQEDASTIDHPGGVGAKPVPSNEMDPYGRAENIYVDDPVSKAMGQRAAAPLGSSNFQSNEFREDEIVTEEENIYSLSSNRPQYI